MFDVGFSELMVIAVVALIVIGPERLPKVARTMGHLFGRLQRYVNDVKADINREIELEELRKFKSTFEDAAHSMEQTFHSEAAKTEAEANSLTGAADAPPSGSGEPAQGGAKDRTVAEELKALKDEIEETGRSIDGSVRSVQQSLQSGESAAQAEQGPMIPKEQSPAADAARQKTPA